MMWREELELARHMVAEAGKEILRYFQQDLVIETKTDSSPVTIADRKAEERIRAIAEKETPGFGIIGEEFGGLNDVSRRQWIVDPIDGTKSFVIGVPFFGTLLALAEEGRIVVGVIGLHALGHTLWASQEGGAFVDGAPARVSTTDKIAEALLLDGCQTTIERLGYAAAWRSLRGRAKMARGWGDCYGHFLVATGRAEVMVDPVAEMWDVAPLAIILPEAGGRFSDLRGVDSIASGSGLSTNGRIHAEIVSAFEPPSCPRAS